MRDDTTTQSVMFPEMARKPVVVRFDEERGSSDGGAVLLAAADRRLGLTAALADCVRDWRDETMVVHRMPELVRQRVFALACGYPDGNDASRLAADPIHKLLVGRDPLEGDDLASQPTISRFENAARRADLFRMGECLADTVIERHRTRLGKKVRRITIDLDQTDDPTHGAQQLAMFNGYYESWCYIPLVGFLTFNDEPEQYLFAALLRPGNAPDKRGAKAVLARLLPRLRRSFPKAHLRVRLDAGFSAPEILDFLDEERVEYVVAFPKNSVLLAEAKPWIEQAQAEFDQTKVPGRVYGQLSYQAGTWTQPRRVIVKAEVVCQAGREPKSNPRFVITNLPQGPAWVYERIYCQRGEIENRIKELHHGLEIDRTSCSRFLANQFRVFLTAAAYVLMQELRLRAARTAFARAQVSTLRDHLLKIGARVRASVRRLVLHFPKSFPAVDAWARIASALGATT